MNMPKPSTGHLQLERLAGAWKGEEKMYPSPWDPKGGTATGRMTHEVSLSGFALLGGYEQERHGVVTFTGHSVFTYDPEADLFSLHWFDCLGTPPEVFTGRFQGNSLVLGHGGPGMHAHFTYDLGDPGNMKTKMEMSPDGAEWKTLFEGRYKRV